LVTIVIPCRDELYLDKTVADIFAKATGEIEVIVVYDNCWNEPQPPDDPRLTIIHWGERRGLRAAVNAGAEIGRGDYLMKVDAHCMFAPGFDEALVRDCESNWVVIPRRYSLDADEWKIKKDRPVVDYMYLAFPFVDENHQLGFHGKNWLERGKERRSIDIDETMSFQGSAWFMPMQYFKDLIYPMDEANYGLFIGEPQEIAMKVWLSGGRVMVNKKTWYAHLWKGREYRAKFREKYNRDYTRVGRQERKRGNAFSLDYWFNDRWEDRTHDLAWLVERFMPVPTWSENREEWSVLPTESEIA
jgi:glycosyltransferase involved in cell wall biosynthesis